MPDQLHIDHVGIAVRSVEAAADQLEELIGFRRRTAVVTNTRQKVSVLFLSRPGSIDIKLIEPSAEDSPLWGFLRRGEGLHHLCFKVTDVSAACAALSGRGARVVVAPSPGEAFDDHPIAFCYLGLGLNIELIDTDARRADRLWTDAPSRESRQPDGALSSIGSTNTLDKAPPGPVVKPYRPGIGREYYANLRSELVPFLPDDFTRVLEVGCGEGVFASLLSKPNEYWGVEPNEHSASLAAARLFRVLPGPYERVADELPDGYFDLAICNDVIEHLPDPEQFLSSLKTKLTSNATVFASIPNVRHWEILMHVVFEKDWRYRASGGMDRTHLRFFTRKSIIRLFEHAGFTVELISGINGSRVLWRRIVFRLAAFLSLGLLDDIGFPQFVLRARLRKA